MAGTQRYWDGQKWTEHVAPLAGPQVPSPHHEGGAPPISSESGPGGSAPRSEPRNGLGIGSLSCGIVGMLFGIVPLTGFIAFALGAVGLILGLSGRGRLKRGAADNKGVTWSGIVCSLIALVLGVIGMVIVFTAVDQFGEDLDDIGSDLDSYSQCIEDAETAEEMARCE